MSASLEPYISAKNIPFPVNGQGTFFYTTKTDLRFSILATPENDKKAEDDKTPSKYIALRIDNKGARFVIKTPEVDNEVLLNEITKPTSYGESPSVDAGVMVTYWYSYDREELCLKYGKGYTMTETTQLAYSFLKDCKTPKEKKAVREKYIEYFNGNSKMYVWVYKEPIIAQQTLIDIEPTFRFAPDPFTVNYPFTVLDSSEVTLFDLDRDKHMFSKSLPLACQELYYNIKNCELNYPLNPVMKLSDAIRYSLNTTGCMLNTKILEKVAEFGKLEETYLRVTLGPDVRTAPGIPYVLEIWPKGHMSPIHNHGGACAVIKVLFGRITVNIYNKLSNPDDESKHHGSPKVDEPKVITYFDAKEGDVTWIGPNWYQTHMLHNKTDDFCATIQCYRYEKEDTIHYSGFDYINTSGTGDHLEEFYPNSDFSFIKLRSQVLEEYGRYLGGESPPAARN